MAWYLRWAESLQKVPQKQRWAWLWHPCEVKQSYHQPEFVEHRPAQRRQEVCYWSEPILEGCPRLFIGQGNINKNQVRFLPLAMIDTMTSRKKWTFFFDGHEIACIGTSASQTFQIARNAAAVLSYRQAPICIQIIANATFLARPLLLYTLPPYLSFCALLSFAYA